MNKNIFNDKKIVVASHNKGKVDEITDLLKPLNIDILSAKNFKLKEPIENGLSFEENALIKSSYVSKKTFANIDMKNGHEKNNALTIAKDMKVKEI